MYTVVPALALRWCLLCTVFPLLPYNGSYMLNQIQNGMMQWRKDDLFLLPWNKRLERRAVCSFSHSTHLRSLVSNGISCSWRANCIWAFFHYPFGDDSGRLEGYLTLSFTMTGLLIPQSSRALKSLSIHSTKYLWLNIPW